MPKVMLGYWRGSVSVRGGVFMKFEGVRFSQRGSDSEIGGGPFQSEGVKERAASVLWVAMPT